MSRAKTDRDLLVDLRDYLDKAASFTNDGRDAFYANEMAQFAIIRVYEVIGEIVKRLSLDVRQNNPQIDWRKLAGFRDFLSHNYDEIILEFVWQAVEDLPVLRAAVDTVIATLPATDEA
ncbi:MAG: HepT-like ribonuclease domain-containing protein [bacterium]|nr:HepT-like ribonuclease domain-containing protein [bacterium]